MGSKKVKVKAKFKAKGKSQTKRKRAKLDPRLGPQKLPKNMTYQQALKYINDTLDKI